MPTFTYSAVDRGGRQTSGQIDARDRDQAFLRLGEQGLQAFSLESVGSAQKVSPKRATSGGSKEDLPSRREGVRLTPKQLLEFTEEISDLLAADLPLEPALQSMENRASKSQVQTVVSRVREKVRDGMSFSNALRQSSPSFSELYCNLVSAGETSGALTPTLQQQLRYLKMMAELRSKMTSSMVYPAFLVAASLAVTVLFLTFLIPKLTVLMEATGSEPPLVAVALMAASEFLRESGWMLAIGAVVVPGLLFLWFRLPANRRTWDALKLRLPLIRGMTLAGFHVQFLETLSTVTRNGLTLVKGLDLCVGATGNLLLREKIRQIREEVADGSSLSRSLARSGVFPPLLSDLVRVGERTGRMTETLGKAAERFDKELGRYIDRLSMLIQPVTIVFMALLVGTMAYIMISVIYDTISLLRRG